MKRFTEKDPTFLGGYTITQEVVETNNTSPLIAKLGIIEDLEEHFGIDMEVIAKAILNGIYGYSITGEIIHVDFDYTALNEACLTFNEVFKSYGKTWSLRKEDLEK